MTTTITIGLCDDGSMGAEFDAAAYEQAARTVIARRYPGAAIETSERAEGIALSDGDEGDSRELSRAVFEEYCAS